MGEPDIWRTPPSQKPEGDLVDQLTDYGREKMLREMLAGVATYCSLDQATAHEHPAAVVEAYRRTAMIRQDADYERSMARARLPPGEREGRLYTLEELRLELGLDREAQG